MNKASTHSVKELYGKFEWPIYKDKVKNVQIHFEKKLECGKKIDLEHFIKIHDEFKKLKRNFQNRIKVQKAQNKAKFENNRSFDAKHNEASRKSKANLKGEDKKYFDDKTNKASRKSKAKLKGEDN